MAYFIIFFATNLLVAGTQFLVNFNAHKRGVKRSIMSALLEHIISYFTIAFIQQELQIYVLVSCLMPLGTYNAQNNA